MAPYDSTLLVGILVGGRWRRELGDLDDQDDMSDLSGLRYQLG